MRHIFIVTALTLSAASALAGLADAETPIPKIDKVAAQTIAKALGADPSVVGLFERCPADAYRSRRDATGVTDVALSFCAREPMACLTQCLQNASAEYCFTLAQIVQDNAPVDPIYGETLYQLSCASGQAAGCVNRAASIRNRRYARDPFTKKPDPDRELCTFRAFRIGCDAGYAWGCSMMGEALKEGEGTTRNAEKARAAFKKACSLSAPDHPSCSFSREDRAGRAK